MLPDGAVSWPAGTGGAVLLAAVVVAVGAALWRCPRLRPLALAALVGLVVLGWPLRQSVRGWPPPETVAVVCDVGQGDAIALPTGPGAAILIDAGPDVGAVDRCLDRLGITALPLVLVSHLDADHAAGLRGALEGRDVGVVATGSLSPLDDRVSSFAALVDRSGAERITLVPGDRRTVGQATVEVLAPDPGSATAAAAANDLSMVVRVTARGISLLFTGDLGAEAEARLRRGGTDLRADVLKVPHHGSADADPEFLAATGARLALVSVGADNTSPGIRRRASCSGCGRPGCGSFGPTRTVTSRSPVRRADWGVAVRGPSSGTRRAHAPLPHAGDVRRAGGRIRPSPRTGLRPEPCRIRVASSLLLPAGGVTGMPPIRRRNHGPLHLDRRHHRARPRAQRRGARRDRRWPSLYLQLVEVHRHRRGHDGHGRGLLTPVLVGRPRGRPTSAARPDDRSEVQ